MTKGERAAQIWPLLTLCASKRQTLTYDYLGPASNRIEEKANA